MTTPRLLATLGIALLLAGCTVFGQDPVSGYLVTYIQTPYTIDLNNTPVMPQCGEGSILRIREPFSGYGIYTELNTNAVADIAREHGLETVYFADLRTFSLFNIWRSQTLTLYGKPAVPRD